ncbi:MAG: type IV pilin protein [Pseudomonadota bacterium]
MAGFTLTEILVAVAIVGILAGLALPQYNASVQRGRLTDAYAGLAGMQPDAERYWSNNHTYVGMPAPGASSNFTFDVGTPTTSTYTLTATGKGPMTGFTYTLDQSGKRATTHVPDDSWTKTDGCWVNRKDGSCAQ